VAGTTYHLCGGWARATGNISSNLHFGVAGAFVERRGEDFGFSGVVVALAGGGGGFSRWEVEVHVAPVGCSMHGTEPGVMDSGRGNGSDDSRVITRIEEKTTRRHSRRAAARDEEDGGEEDSATTRRRGFPAKAGGQEVM